MRRALRQLRTYLGRVYRDVGRKIADSHALEGRFAPGCSDWSSG
jgi:IS5 family transposase